MKLILCVSSDGYLARNETDDRAWAGVGYGAVLKLLTCSGGAHCVTSERTAANLPQCLPGRTLDTVSRSRKTLKSYALEHPNAWLLGGLQLAESAIADDLLWDVYLCYVSTKAYPEGGGGVQDTLSNWLRSHPNWRLSMDHSISDVGINQWRKIV